MLGNRRVYRGKPEISGTRAAQTIRRDARTRLPHRHLLLLDAMFNLQQYLTNRHALAEAHMASHMPPASTRPARLHAAMHHSLFGGGKRLRPILALAACEAVGGKPEQALHAGCAIELLHTYTLIHDDLPAMDDDDLRRGRPTCHIAFDEATAILAGDALQTMAFEWLAESTPPPPHTAADLVLELTRAAGSRGVIGGQMEDIAAEGKPGDADLLDFIHHHKTGDLLVASVRIGARCGGSSIEQLNALTTYARHAGLAFQIADDVLNATSTAEKLGKAVGSDAARGKLTYVSLHGLDAARAKASALVNESIGALNAFGPEADPLRAIARYIVDRES
jgi:geranylgeranyl diphosphate synthase type II